MTSFNTYECEEEDEDANTLMLSSSSPQSPMVNSFSFRIQTQSRFRPFFDQNASNSQMGSAEAFGIGHQEYGRLSNISTTAQIDDPPAYTRPPKGLFNQCATKKRRHNQISNSDSTNFFNSEEAGNPQTHLPEKSRFPTKRLHRGDFPPASLHPSSSLSSCQPKA